MPFKVNKILICTDNVHRKKNINKYKIKIINIII